ncbi:MAG: TIM barrel protein [Terriglobia bacterium]|jgi:hydroxypyruvate isomerase
MNRRDFSKAVAGATLSTTALALQSLAAPSISAGGDSAGPAPFKISVMLWTVFQKLPFAQRLEKVREAGYRAVELVGEYAEWSEEDFRQANRKRRELGITIDTTAGLKPRLADPRAREAFLADVRNELIIMEKIECPALIILAGNVIPDLSAQAQHDSCVEGLKRAAELLEGKGVTLLLENIDLEENPQYYLWSVPEAFKIIEEVNHPQVKFLYDFYHAQISGGNLIAHLQKHVDKVGLVHIADVPGRHEPGTGEINYVNIYKTLAELKYSRYVTMEFFPTGNPVKALAAAREEALRAAQA